MAERKDFHYNDKYHCSINIHRGIAAGVNKERTVYTETSGGDGHIHTGLDGKVRGKINPITTTSHTRIHDKYFLRNQTSGQEEDFAMTDWDIALRDGHDAAAVWIVPHGSDWGPFIAFHNYTLQKTSWRADRLPAIFQLKKPLSLRILDIIVWISSILLAIALAKQITAGLLLLLLFLVAAGVAATTLNAYLYKLACGARDAENAAARKALSDRIIQMLSEAKP